MRALPPGPRLPAHVQAAAFAFRFPEFTAACHRRYGESFTVRLPSYPPSVITRDRDAIRRLVTGDPLTRRHNWDVLLPLLGRQSLLLLDPAEHLARRKLEARPFHGERIRALVQVVEELVHSEIDGWRSGETLAVHARARRITLEVILRLVIGTRDEQLRDQLARIYHAMQTPVTTAGMFVTPSMTRRARWNLFSRAYWLLQDRLDALLREQIARTQRDPELETRDDVLALLVTARDEEGNGLDDEQLRDELVTLVTVGHDTTATAVAWGVDLLAHNPDVVRRGREALADGRREWIKAAAKEVVRLRTVLPISTQRIVLEPFEIGEHVVPAGTAILVNAFGLHGDDALHPDAATFRPERFLDDSPDAYAYMPFGGGPRRCLGASLASMELETVLEGIVTRCDLEPVGRPARPARRGVTMVPSGGARVRLAAVRPRERVLAAS